ncbi:MAG TPA: hypothetical protein V6C81_11585 [Planktothrix sp.]
MITSFFVLVLLGTLGGAVWKQNWVAALCGFFAGYIAWLVVLAVTMIYMAVAAQAFGAVICLVAWFVLMTALATAEIKSAKA